MSTTTTNVSYKVNDDNKIPPWMLAPYEEKEVRKITQEQANTKCAELFKKFGDCSKQHQILFSWKCADEKKAMIDCIAYWGSREVFEQERNKFIEKKIAKANENNEKS